MVMILNNTPEINLKQFSPFFYYIGPMMSFWLPKQHFLGILRKLKQISAFYSTIKGNLPLKTMTVIIYNIQEIILKQIFPQNFPLFWPYDDVLTSKTALCEQFEQFLQISAFYSIITWKLPHNNKVEIVYDIHNMIWNYFSQKVFTIWP